MCWFSAGTDEEVKKPDLFGCVQMPDPSACFGPSIRYYSKRDRDFFINFLRNERRQSEVWPQEIRECFASQNESPTTGGGPANNKPGKSHACSMNRLNPVKPHLFGSPMLDVRLGRGDSIKAALLLLTGEGTVRSADICVAQNTSPSHEREFSLTCIQLSIVATFVCGVLSIR